MAITLKQIRGRCLTEIQDHSPDASFPSIDVEIRKAISELARKIGGIRSTVTINTVVDQQEYDSDDNFPTDAIGIYGVVDVGNGYRLEPIPRNQRSENVGSGSPSSYYIYQRNTIGFDVPASQVKPYRIDYLGLGVQISNDDDVVMSTLPAVKDDSMWEAIVFEVAKVYHRRNMFNDTSENNRHERAYYLYKKEALTKRYEVMSYMNGLNRDEGFEVVLDEDYFGQAGRNSMLRFGNSGDIIRVS